MGFKYKEEGFNWGTPNDIDGQMFEARCCVPLYGDIPKEEVLRSRMIGSVPHKIFRQQLVLNSTAIYAGGDLAVAREKVLHALFRDVHMHRAHSSYAVGPMTDVALYEGNRVVKIPDTKANQMYSQLTGM